MRLLMAQVDDVPGELIGEFIRRAEALGARNVQVVPALTKKGRPSYIVYLDVAAHLETEAGLLLGLELGTWGYRVLAAEHRHFDIARLEVVLAITVAATNHEFPLRAKTISDGERLLRVKAEHDDLSAICATLRGGGISIALAVLKSAVESRLYEQDDRTHVAVHL